MKNQNKKAKDSYAFIAREMRLYIEHLQKPKKKVKKRKPKR